MRKIEREELTYMCSFTAQKACRIAHTQRKKVGGVEGKVRAHTCKREREREGGGGERERERGGRERETETERDRERERDRETERQRDRERQRETESLLMNIA